MTLWRRVLRTLRGFVKADAASQLAFDLKPRPIAHPGSHGGRGYYDSKGQWQYGERPAYVPSKFWAKHPEEAARHKEHYERQHDVDPHIREYERTGKPVEFEAEGGKQVYVLHKIPRKEGGHRVTRFDERGPSGHTEHKTIAEAVRELRSSYPSGRVNQGHLDRWSDTETWKEGIHQVHHAKVWNEKRHKWFEEQHTLRDRGEITKEEYDRRYKQFQDEEDADFERTKALFKGCLLFMRAGGAGQLAFDLRQPVAHPGVRGGHGFYNRWGQWEYGEKPTGFQETPGAVPVEDVAAGNLPLPGEPDLRSYDWLLVNISGGKDSQAALDETVRQADAQGVSRSRIVAVHEVMSDVDHPGANDLAARQAAHYGLRFESVTRTLGTLLEHAEQKGKFPGMRTTQWCTSDHKRAQADKLITKLCDEARTPLHRRVRLLNIMGIRGNESPERGKQAPFSKLKRFITNSKKDVDQWLPIHSWQEADVWDRIKASGVEFAPSYAWAPRFSCPFCIYGSKEEHVEAARRYPEMAERYAQVEEKIGHTVARDRSMREVIAEAAQRGLVKAHCYLHGDYMIAARPLLFQRSKQLGFDFGKPREPVKEPGSRGGHGYFDEHGTWQYGDRPSGHPGLWQTGSEQDRLRAELSPVGPEREPHLYAKLQAERAYLAAQLADDGPPETRVGSYKRGQGSTRWWARAIGTTGHFPGLFDTKREAVEMARRNAIQATANTRGRIDDLVQAIGPWRVDELDGKPAAALTPAEPYERSETIDGVPTVIRQGSPDDPFKYRSQFHVTMAYDAEGYPGESRKLHAASLDEYRALLASRQPNPNDVPTGIPVADVHKVRVGPDALAGDAWEGTVADAEAPVLAYRGISDLAELHGEGGWQSTGGYTVKAFEGATTQFASQPEGILKVQAREPTGAYIPGSRAYRFLVTADLRGLPFRTLREPVGDRVQADLGLGLGIAGAIPHDRIVDVQLIKDDGTLGPHMVADALTPPATAAYREHGIRAPLFKAWFGDWEADPANASKVVKPNGEPQETYDFKSWIQPAPPPPTEGPPVTMYHGTSSGGFEEFDPLKSDTGALYGPGFYFTEDKAIAEGYARGRLAQEMPDAKAQELARFVRKHLPEWARLKRSTHMIWNLTGGGPHQRHSQYYVEDKRDQRPEHAGRTRTLVLGTTVDGPGSDIGFLPTLLGWNEITTTAWKRHATHHGWKTLSTEVKECYLNIRKPFVGDRDRVPIASIPAEFIARHPTLDMMPTPGGDSWERWGRPDPDNPPAATYRQLSTAMHSRRAVNELLKTLGYDGITHIGGIITGQDRLHRVWIAFNPEQVKAVDNAGTFDPSNRNIFKHRLVFLRARARAQQLGLFRGKARRQVEHPGLHGARWWLSPTGRVTYTMPALSSAGRLPIEKPHDAVLHFRSGASDVTTMAAYAAAGVPIGIDVQVISGPARIQLARYVQQGGQAFTDSGAFSAYKAWKKGNRPTQITRPELQRALDRYNEMVDRSLDSPSIRSNPDLARDIAARWHLSAPDHLGDQDAGLAEVEHFAPQVRKLMDKGITLIVPLQKGAMSLAEYHARVLKLLGGRTFVSAMPSNEEAVPLEDIIAFAKQVQPGAIHLLGIGEPHITEARRRAIQAVSPHTVVTSDSCRLTAIVGTGRPFTEAVKAEQYRVLDELAAEAKKRRLLFSIPKQARNVGPAIRARMLAAIEGWTPAAGWTPAVA